MARDSVRQRSVAASDTTGEHAPQKKSIDHKSKTPLLSLTKSRWISTIFVALVPLIAILLWSGQFRHNKKDVLDLEQAQQHVKADDCLRLRAREVHAMNKEEWGKMLSSPLIIEGFVAVQSLEEFVAAHGEKHVKPIESRGPVFAQFGSRDVAYQKEMTVSDFLQSLQSSPESALHVFDVGSTSADLMLKEFEPPRNFPSSKAQAVVSLGNQVGVAFHQHGAAWLATLAGSKRWFLFPPGSFPQRNDSAHLQAYLSPVEHWRTSQLNLKGMLSCVVHAGDAMILPAMWWHATENGHDKGALAIGQQRQIRSYSEKDLKALVRTTNGDLRARAALAMKESQKGARKPQFWRDAARTMPYDFFIRLQYLSNGFHLQDQQSALDMSNEADSLIRDLLNVTRRGWVPKSDAKDTLRIFAKHFAGSIPQLVRRFEKAATDLEALLSREDWYREGTRSPRR